MLSETHGCATDSLMQLRRRQGCEALWFLPARRHAAAPLAIAKNQRRQKVAALLLMYSTTTVPHWRRAAFRRSKETSRGRP